MNETLLSALSNSPWAIMAGFLLVTVLKAWREDRQRLDSTISTTAAAQAAQAQAMTAQAEALRELRDAVSELSAEQHSIRVLIGELSK